MEKRLLQTKEEYKVSLKRLESLTDKGEKGETNEDEEKEIEFLSLIIGEYEDKHYPVDPPNPIEYLRFILEHKNIKQQDLVNLLRINKSTLSNVLNYRKRLSLDMIRALHKKFKISYDILMQEYELKH